MGDLWDWFGKVVTWDFLNKLAIVIAIGGGAIFGVVAKLCHQRSKNFFKKFRKGVSSEEANEAVAEAEHKHMVATLRNIDEMREAEHKHMVATLRNIDALEDLKS